MEITIHPIVIYYWLFAIIFETVYICITWYRFKKEAKSLTPLKPIWIALKKNVIVKKIINPWFYIALGILYIIMSGIMMPYSMYNIIKGWLSPKTKLPTMVINEDLPKSSSKPLHVMWWDSLKPDKKKYLANKVLSKFWPSDSITNDDILAMQSWQNDKDLSEWWNGLTTENKELLIKDIFDSQYTIDNIPDYAIETLYHYDATTELKEWWDSLGDVIQTELIIDQGLDNLDRELSFMDMKNMKDHHEVI